MINNNISFTGYKNIIATANSKAGKDNVVTYIAMQLNNEGKQDLFEYQKLQKMQNYVDDKNDILLLTHILDLKSMTENIYLGLKNMFLGNELRLIEENFVPEKISQEMYEKEKSLHMKAYTLLASLTKRIKDEKFNLQDENIAKVIKYLHSTLYDIKKNGIPLFDFNQSFRLTELGCLGVFKFQDIARSFNNGITHTMDKFFEEKRG